MTAGYGDLSKLAADLATASGSNIYTAASILVKDTGTQIQNLSRQMAPVKTGALRDSIVATYPDPLTVNIGPGVPYGGYVEYGTRPHVIKPKKASVLRFKVNGVTVYARAVKHPGTKAQPYMRPAFEQAVSNLSKRMLKLAEQMIGGQR